MKQAIEEKEQALQDMAEAKQAIEVYQEKAERAEKELSKEKARNDRLETMNSALQAVYDKMKSTF